MTIWHADAELLAAYAGGRLDLARTASVEQHVMGCGVCRARVGAVADRSLLDRVWADTVDVLDRPRVSFGERILTRFGLGAPAARLACTASAARRAWLWACALLTVFAWGAPGVDGRMAVWLLIVSPLVPVTGVAIAYGPETDPMHEVVASSPYPRLRLVLLRSLLVVPVIGVLLLVSSLSVPGGPDTAVLWLLPGLAMTVTTLALEGRFGSLRVAVALSLGWIAFAAGTRLATGSGLAVYGPPVQLVCLAALAAAATALAARGLHGSRRSLR
jgi:hypothetical protein